jgi:hypothetical protein
MRYSYLDYLTEHKIRYYNALGILFFFSLFCLTVSVMLLNQRYLSINSSIYGEVSQIKKDTISRPSEATYSNHNVKRSVLIIIINGKKFTLERQYKEYRDVIFNDVNIGDTLLVYYKKDNYNQNIPLQIERNNEIIFPFSYFLKTKNKALFILVIVFFIATSVAIILIFKRYKFLNEIRLRQGKKVED